MKSALAKLNKNAVQNKYNNDNKFYKKLKYREDNVMTRNEKDVFRTGVELEVLANSYFELASYVNQYARREVKFEDLERLKICLVHSQELLDQLVTKIKLFHISIP